MNMFWSATYCLRQESFSKKISSCKNLKRKRLSRISYRSRSVRNLCTSTLSREYDTISILPRSLYLTGLQIWSSQDTDWNLQVYGPLVNPLSRSQAKFCWMHALRENLSPMFSLGGMEEPDGRAYARLEVYSALQLSVCQETRSPPYSKGSNHPYLVCRLRQTLVM